MDLDDISSALYWESEELAWRLRAMRCAKKIADLYAPVLRDPSTVGLGVSQREARDDNLFAIISHVELEARVLSKNHVVREIASRSMTRCVPADNIDVRANKYVLTMCKPFTNHPMDVDLKILSDCDDLVVDGTSLRRTEIGPMVIHTGMLRCKRHERRAVVAVLHTQTTTLDQTLWLAAVFEFEPAASINDVLPCEMLDLILRQVGARDLANCRRVCRAWKYAADVARRCE